MRLFNKLKEQSLEKMVRLKQLIYTSKIQNIIDFCI